jgi:hypothetical protein
LLVKVLLRLKFFFGTTKQRFKKALNVVLAEFENARGRLFPALRFYSSGFPSSALRGIRFDRGRIPFCSSIL